MLDIKKTIQDFFSNDNIPHHFFTLESHVLKPNDIVNLLPKQEFGYLFKRHYDSLGIDDAKKIIALQNEKTEKKSMYIISATIITTEAQNAFLKSLEEPKQNKIFFFIISNIKKLIPTLQSRTYLLIDKTIQISGNRFNIHDFITMNLQERFEYIKKITDKKNKQDDILSKSDLLDVLNDFEIHYHNEKNITMLRKITAARKYMHTKGSSSKMILEDIAMTISLLG